MAWNKDEVVSIRNLDDINQVAVMYHRCSAGAAKQDDVLEFPVGLYGVGYGSGDLRSFKVPAECPACGQWVTLRFRWQVRQLFLP